MGRIGLRRCIALFIGCLLISCSQQHDDSQETPAVASSPSAPNDGGNAAGSAQTPALPTSLTRRDGDQATATIVRGSGRVLGDAAPSRAAARVSIQNGDVSLNFLNADVRDVIKAVLGDMLKLNYEVESGVQGVVTIQTNQPIARDAVLPAFEQALRFAGLAVVESGALYKVMPVADAPRQSVISGPTSSAASQPGFGVEIVPLKYVSAAEMQRVLDPIIPSGSILRADASRNFFIIAGTEQERQLVKDDIALFDVDWLAGQSFAIYPLKSVDAKAMAAELMQVLGAPLAGMVQLFPMPRMNGLLAISPQPKYLEELQTWIERLDRSSQAADRQIFVYYVQNGRASDLAGVLTKVLSSGGQSDNGSIPPASAGGTTSLPPSASFGFQTGSSLPGGSLTQGQLPAVMIPSGPIASPLPQQNPAGGSVTVASAGPAQGGALSSLSGVRITSDDNNNALLVLATPQEYSVIEGALRKLDIAPLQIMLEAAVAEVTLTNDLQYGLQYYLKTGHHEIVNSNSLTSAIAPTFPGFAYLFSTGSDISIVLNALENVTHVDVLSAPKVLVVNNQTATLQIGDEVPVPVQSAVSVSSAGAPIVNSIEFKDTGVILKVIPRVNQGGEVQMDIDQEVSDVAPTASTSSAGLSAPTIEQRKISSTVVVQDGETIALGGLISTNKNVGKNGMPLFQDIPIVGSLFGTTTNNQTRTELLVLITPHVVQGVERARSITDELRHELPTTKPVFEPRR